MPIFQDCHIPLATLPSRILGVFRKIANFAKIATYFLNRFLPAISNPDLARPRAPPKRCAF
jgi:hypothetical protein